jgi:GNAT superfamily N-acetyltransferase
MCQNIFTRIAVVSDIAQIQKVRNAVKENRLSNPALVPDSDVEDYIIRRGRGWVCEMDGSIVGFSIISLADKNVWALFIQPGFEKKGIGRKLHDLMLNWYFAHTKETVWLSTAPGTRAESFYRKAGWQEAGTYGKGEIKFIMSHEDWHQLSSIPGQ